MADSLALLGPDSIAKIEQIRLTSRALANVHEVLPIDSDEGRTKAQQLLRVIETISREAEALRKRDKAPHLKAGQEVDDEFGTATEHLKRVGKAIRDRLGEWAVAREQAQNEQRRIATEAAAVSNATIANLALADPVFAPVETTKGVAEIWSWEVDAIDMAAIPREFLIPDLPKIKALIRDCDRSAQEPKIAGVVFRRSVGQRVRSL